MSKSWSEVIENIDLSTKPLREPRKLSCDEITDLKEKCNPKYDLTILDLICTIEALQQENEQLKAELSQWSYLGDIATTELIAERLHYIPTLKHENEQLRARVERMREVCIKGYSYLSLLFHRADIRNWNNVGMCSVKDIKHVLCELESAYKSANTVQDYHNPADVEALRKAREAIQRAKENFEPYGEYEYDVRYDLEDALAEIDKAIGGKEE